MESRELALVQGTDSIENLLVIMDTPAHIQNTPARIEVNFIELETALKTELEKYDVVVTADTLAGAKKLAANLNKIKKTIDDTRKAEIAKASVGFSDFDENMRDLVMMCAKGRSDITTQIDVFNTETLNLVRALLVDIRLSLWQQHNVQVEYQNASIEDLVKIGFLTKTKKLTKGAVTELEKRVLENCNFQAYIGRRLAELSSRCYEAGLTTPLTREHVESFLKLDEAAYENKLRIMLSREIERQVQAEAKMRAQVAKEQASRSESAAPPQPAPAAQQAPYQQPPISAPAANEEPVLVVASTQGRVGIEITCTFRTEVDVRVSDQQIEDALLAKMKKAEITTLDSINIGRFNLRDERKTA